ncbi:MAG: amidohydrolase family protein [Chitinophagales bacterium]
MKNIFTLLLICCCMNLFAQQVPVVISGGTIHVGNGTVIENGMVIIKNGKIEYAGTTKEPGYDINNVSAIDASGKHIYPGIIAMNAQVGLKEIELVRSTIDIVEVGEFNPNIRSLIAYNTDSKVIPTLRTNGILLAQVIPDGGIISGQSSVVKMSGWNWEDAVVDTDDNMHMDWPSVYSYNYEKGFYIIDPKYTENVNAIRSFISEAKAYCSAEKHETKNLRFEAMRKIFNGEQKLFIKADRAKEIIGAVDLAKAYSIKVVIVGGRQSYKVQELLKENNIPVLLESTHELPAFEGDDVDLPYKLPAMLMRAGILCGLTMSNDGSSYWNVRNLPFDAGTAAAYGLSKEEALELITLNNAKILGIENNYGTVETGKSATLFISEGDVLDMKTSILTNIFIQGERIDVENWQDELSRKYSIKYGIEVK